MDREMFTKREELENKNSEWTRKSQKKIHNIENKNELLEDQ